MYLNEKDIKALRTVLNDIDGRVKPRQQKAIKQLNKSLQANDRRVQTQREMIKRATTI